jgi:hypothetical protein
LAQHQPVWWSRLIGRPRCAACGQPWTCPNALYGLVRDLDEERAVIERQRLQLRAELGWREPDGAEAPAPRVER